MSSIRRASLDIKMSWLTRSKNCSQVHIDHPAIAGSDMLAGRFECVVSAASQTDAEARIRERRVVPALQGLIQGLLNQSIDDGRDGLRELHRPSGRRLGCGSCSSDREFACCFIPIPPRGGHPCSWARSSCHQGLRRNFPQASRILGQLSLPGPQRQAVTLRVMPNARNRKGPLLRAVPISQVLQIVCYARAGLRRRRRAAA